MLAEENGQERAPALSGEIVRPRKREHVKFKDKVPMQKNEYLGVENKTQKAVVIGLRRREGT